MIEQRVETEVPLQLFPVPDAPTGDALRDLEEEPTWTPRAGRRGSREKFAAGLRGLKHAFRGDSSFFAHTYRGILIAMTAALLRVDPLGWCFLVIAGCFVLLAELAHSAIVNLSHALASTEDPSARAACEIAAAAVLVVSFASGGLTLTVLIAKFGELMGWWGR